MFRSWRMIIVKLSLKTCMHSVAQLGCSIQMSAFQRSIITVVIYRGDVDRISITTRGDVTWHHKPLIYWRCFPNKTMEQGRKQPLLDLLSCNFSILVQSHNRSIQRKIYGPIVSKCLSRPQITTTSRLLTQWTNGISGFHKACEYNTIRPLVIFRKLSC